MKHTPMRNDFCAFILTNGRPNNVKTYKTLRNHGYTGKIFIVIDDEDATGEQYKKLYGDDVLVFSKDAVSNYTDQFDNFPNRNGVLWARNVCWDLARGQGYRFFVELDDDIYSFQYKMMGRGHVNSISSEKEFHSWKMPNFDGIFNALVTLVETTPINTIALAQGGDHIGGERKTIRFKRKAMNSFVLDTEKPFLFQGRMNDDVNTYVNLGGTGKLFFTDMEIQLSADDTQSSEGGMTETYLAYGTYVKSFYTVMMAPSCVSINLMGVIRKRLHHRIDWNKAVPKILSERIKQ